MRYDIKHPVDMTPKECSETGRLHRKVGQMLSFLHWYGVEKSARVVMAKENGVVRGWAFGAIRGGEYEVHIYVNRKYRRQGIGTMLLQMMEGVSISQEVDIHVWMYHDNMEFWKAKGYCDEKEVGEFETLKIHVSQA